VEESMGGGVSREEASVHYPGADLIETSLRWTPALGDGGRRFLAIFKTWLPLVDFNNAKWIRRQWLEMFLKKCGIKIREVRKKRRRGNR